MPPSDIHIPGSQSTPRITSDRTSGLLRMEGDSYPENALDLFGPVIAWVEQYLADAGPPLVLELCLVYLNTSSIKAMMEIFDVMENAHGNGRAVAVTWYYDNRNERVAELAQEFKEDCSFPFAILPHDP
jgi:hypothetical protein